MYQILSSSHDRLHPAVSHKRNRNRGVFLSKQGWQKLIQAGVLYDQWGNRYTYERLSERSLLNERTISRILSCEVRVDKRTLKTFFAAFSLCLDGNDYTTSEDYSAGQPLTCLPLYLNSTVHPLETDLSYPELIELYQRLVQDLRHLSHLLQLGEVKGNVPLQATEFN
ncbi:MAG TPA: hypothetical protein V6C57_24505 [Coleofasciculaceae cyanobacterium]